MKRRHLMAAVLALILAISVFAGCVNRNANKNSVPPVVENPIVESEPEIATPGSEESSKELDDDGLPDDNAPDREPDPAPEINEKLDPALAAMSADFSKIGALSAAKDTGFPGGPPDAQNRPSGPVAYQQKFEKYGARFIVPGSQKIYLTFDEGYENGYTSRILDILKEKNVKAVFFITYPYAETEPALIKRMIDEGHTLGNHSTKHLIFPDMPLNEAAEDIVKLHEYVKANYGYDMWLFRPPEGAFSEQTLALAQALGYDTMLWSFAYKDYDVHDQPLGMEAVSNILQKSHPGEICLLHAVSRTNAEILGEVIDSLKAKGFEFADYFVF